MTETNYKKILIFGTAFNNFSGSGITLSNLFKGWPEDRIAVASTGLGLRQVSTDICTKYYQLGKEEQKWIFPLNLFQRSFPSGLISVKKQEKQSQVPSHMGVRQIIVDRFFFPFIHWLGLINCLSRSALSEQFKEWLSTYRPEVLYIQVSTREAILFSIQLSDYLNIPTVIHMMDDWPSTISNKGLFKKYWKTKIDKEFRQLLNRCDLYFSISNAMTSEYMSRYNKVFKAFHNPIETDAWLPYSKTDFHLNSNHVNILYSGRIGPGISESLIEVASSIESINNGMVIKLHIQSPTVDLKVISRLNGYKCVVINPKVDYSELPKLFSQADLLLIANDFNNEGINFLKYSMPTKISEYMISGTSILVYSSGETAVSKFVTEHNCGFCVIEQSTKKIVNAIQLLLHNAKQRKILSQNAIRVAIELFDSKKVRKEFQELLINISK